MQCEMRSPKVMVLLAIVILSIWVLIHMYRNLGTSPVRGWESASRDVKRYVSERLLPHILPKHFCKENKLLMVMISSRPDGFELRQAIREAWGQKHDNVSFYFLFGEVVDDPLLQHELEIESKRYGDVIQEAFVDSYNNLTIKSVTMLKLFKKFCKNTHSYLMKVDDDVFLNVPLLLEHLTYSERREDVLLGKVRSNIRPERDSSSKWYMPYSWYDKEYYPHFLCGPGYVMSSDVAVKLYHCALQVPLLHVEDVYLTGICSRRMMIRLRNNDMFTCNKLDNNICRYQTKATLHYFKPDEIRYSYRMLSNNYCAGFKEFNVVKQWIFFFNFP